MKTYTKETLFLIIGFVILGLTPVRAEALTNSCVILPSGPYIEYVVGDDDDFDGIPNALEDQHPTIDCSNCGNCQVDELETDKTKTDTDGDGISDFFEMCANTTARPCTALRADIDIDGDSFGNGNDTDADGDGRLDADEDLNKNGRYDAGRLINGKLETDAYNPDTDGDGLTDDIDPCSQTAGDCTVECRIGVPPPAGANSDTDLLPNSDEDLNQNCRFDPTVQVGGKFETNFESADTDSDGLLDHRDILCPRHANLAEDGSVGAAGNPGINDVEHAPEGCIDELKLRLLSDPRGDFDRDGMSNIEEDPELDGEVQAGQTSPFTEDTDVDGLPDRFDGCNDELNGTMPAESFGGSAEEYPVPTDTELQCAKAQCDPSFPKPALKDSDRDGIIDEKEDKDHNCRVDMSGPTSETDPFNRDSDKDNLADGIEDSNKNGEVDATETNPRRADSDGDLIPDGSEDINQDGIYDPSQESNPLSLDSDEDGIPDRYEDTNHDGVCGKDEPCTYLVDTDFDGLSDGGEDCNHNGKIDFGEPDFLNPDTDGDELLDGQEDLSRPGNCIVDKGETSPIDPSTFGQSDKKYFDNQHGIGGCSLARTAEITNSEHLNFALALVALAGLIPLIILSSRIRRRMR